MPFKFNPFTGNFDQTGSGGGGASYIDGEVATYADLPLDGTAPLNSAWLVRTASGVWPVSRKQAGIYIRTATAGSSRDADYTYAGTMPDVFSDAQFLLYDNTDTSKNLAFDLGGINTETTRTLTVPDKSGKIVLQNTSTGTIEPTPIVSSAQRMGSIDLGGDAFGDYRGGLIVMRGDGADGGTLNLSDGGGSVNTSLYGGSILTYGVDAATFLSGGSIITYGGGGDINTRGTGSIGFGSSGTRTTVTGTATANRAISLPNASGTIALTSDFAAPPAIGDTTRNSGAFTTLSANNGTLTASAPVLDLAQTWNDEAVFTASASGTTLTVSAVASGTIRVGMFCYPSGFPGNERTIAALGTGTGGIGTYILNAASGVSSSTTWTGVVNTFKALVVNANSTASLSTSSVLEAQVNGSRVFNITRNGHINLGGEIDFTRNISTANRITSPSTTKLTISCAGGGSIEMFGIGYGAQAMTFGSAGIFIFQGNSDITEQRRTTNPQTFRLYNTYTDASNHERLSLRWASNVAIIGTEKAGTGSARTLELQVDGTTFLGATTGGTVRFGSQSVQSTTLVGWFGNCYLRPVNASAGVLTLLNNALDGFDRLQFGGTTSSFPALKRSTTSLQVRLADDSAYSVLDAQLRAQGTAPASAAAAGTAGDIRYDADYIYVCTAASTWKRAAIATW